MVGLTVWALYEKMLRHPGWVLGAVLLMCVVAGAMATRMSIDASSETLVVEGDVEFAEYRALSERFPGDDFLFMTLTFEHTVFSQANVDHVSALEREIARLHGVTGTLSVASAPILTDSGVVTLNDAPAELERAAHYFSNSMLFQQQLVSRDGLSTAIQVMLAPIAGDFTQGHRDQLIAQLRELRGKFDNRDNIRIAGVPLIAHDMMAYLRADVRNFGLAATVVVCLALFAFFRRLRWVGLCVLCAVLSTVFVCGLLGLLDTPVSVVSGNFVSLLAIISISLTIHLVVRFRELMRDQPDMPHPQRVAETMRSKFSPCFYTAATTIVAFTSLLTSGIPPVEDFGWMMAAGVVCAFIITFTVFPAALLLLGPGTPSSTLHRPMRFSIWLGGVATRRYGLVAVAALLVLAVSVAGISQLELNSRFSQYFKADSDIRRGLHFVDAQFGGVLPLSVVLKYAPFEPETLSEEDDFFLDETPEYPESAWFTRRKVQALEEVAAYLRSRDDVGSVTSFADLAAIAADATPGATLDDLQLALMINLLGEQRTAILAPYANPHSGELRLSVRMRETGPSADYRLVIADIERRAQALTGLEAQQITTTGMYVLFGQSIRQLFDSQRDTLLYVIIATLMMFVVLLRSLPLGGVALTVNVLAAASILGFMGLSSIPMDMMTITIAAIAIGIGVDDAFHYLHRYREQRAAGDTPSAAIAAVHRSIGRAIYFTSVTVIAGFSLLSLSNFVPTIYFGVLTALAMGLALIANLLLLPSLLLVYEGLAARGRH